MYVEHELSSSEALCFLLCLFCFDVHLCVWCYNTQSSEGILDLYDVFPHFLSGGMLLISVVVSSMLGNS